MNRDSKQVEQVNQQMRWDNQQMKRKKWQIKQNRRKKNGMFGRILKVILVLCILAVIIVFGLDFIVRMSTKKMILTQDEWRSTEKVDCILVLGAAVKPDGTPSKMLKDRLDRGIELYLAGRSDKLLMSGDHGTSGYDEVNKMKEYAIAAGVPSEDIFMDHAGFSTYESMYRAKEIFGAGSVIIVTQKYHLYRSLYDAKGLGLSAKGVPALEVRYGGQFYRDLREVAARNKDVVLTFLKAKPTYLGETISLRDSGDVTNDK